MVFTSSAAAIGTRADGFPADETITFNQLPEAFPYAHSKFMAEIEVLKAIIEGLDCVIVNPAVVIVLTKEFAYSRMEPGAMVTRGGFGSGRACPPARTE